MRDRYSPGNISMKGSDRNSVVYDAGGDSATVVEHIKKIRAKFADAGPSVEYISTVWGIGYKWNRI